MLKWLEVENVEDVETGLLTGFKRRFRRRPASTGQMKLQRTNAVTWEDVVFSEDGFVSQPLNVSASAPWPRHSFSSARL